tara:strand:+ start:220 stop:789 length:570 start_codon:yes stop_codon:yes gene_type:complete
MEIKDAEKFVMSVLGPAGPQVRALIPDVRGIVPGLQEAGGTLEEAVEEGSVGKGLEGLLKTLSVPAMAAAEFNPATKKASQVSKKLTRTKTERDYPDTPLSTRLNFDKQIQFLEEHGYSPLTNSKNKDFKYEIVEDKIIAYVPLSGPGNKVEQKTFKNPTLKQMRNWMGYKTGGTLMQSNPNPYEPTAI